MRSGVEARGGGETCKVYLIMVAGGLAWITSIPLLEVHMWSVSPLQHLNEYKHCA